MNNSKENYIFPVNDRSTIGVLKYMVSIVYNNAKFVKFDILILYQWIYLFICIFLKLEEKKYYLYIYYK